MMANWTPSFRSFALYFVKPPGSSLRADRGVYNSNRFTFSELTPVSP
jgi:hypothetical protein